MPKQDKTPKKKSKKKSPQKSGESEYPAMDQEEYNRLLQNAIEQIKAEAEQKFEERLKAVEADREAQIKVWLFWRGGAWSESGRYISRVGRASRFLSL